MTLRRAIRRLRLRPGDALLVHRSLLIEPILRACKFLDPHPGALPILFIDKKNDIRRLSFEELERIYLEAKKTHCD